LKLNFQNQLQNAQIIKATRKTLPVGSRIKISYRADQNIYKVEAFALNNKYIIPQSFRTLEVNTTSQQQAKPSYQQNMLQNVSGQTVIVSQ
jgi:hypothetical protein